MVFARDWVTSTQKHVMYPDSGPSCGGNTPTYCSSGFLFKITELGYKGAPGAVCGGAGLRLKMILPSQRNLANLCVPSLAGDSSLPYIGSRLGF